MKKYVVLSGILALSMSVFALGSLGEGEPVLKNKVETKAPNEEGLKWYSFEEGYAKAVSEGKVLLVDAYTDWCGWCKVMDRKTYANPAIIAKLNESFICVKLNPELETTYNFRDKNWQGSYLLQFLGNGEVSGFPTTIFWPNPGKDEVRYVQPGFLDANDFSQVLDKVKVKKS